MAELQITPTSHDLPFMPISTIGNRHCNQEDATKHFVVVKHRPAIYRWTYSIDGTDAVGKLPLVGEFLRNFQPFAWACWCLQKGKYTISCKDGQAGQQYFYHAVIVFYTPNVIVTFTNSSFVVANIAAHVSGMNAYLAAVEILEQQLCDFVVCLRICIT